MDGDNSWLSNTDYWDSWCMPIHHVHVVHCQSYVHCTSPAHGCVNNELTQSAITHYSNRRWPWQWCIGRAQSTDTVMRGITGMCMILRVHLQLQPDTGGEFREDQVSDARSERAGLKAIRQHRLQCPDSTLQCRLPVTESLHATYSSDWWPNWSLGEYEFSLLSNQ